VSPRKVLHQHITRSLSWLPRGPAGLGWDEVKYAQNDFTLLVRNRSLIGRLGTTTMVVSWWQEELDHPFVPVNWSPECGWLASPQFDRCGQPRSDHHPGSWEPG
jgi:hypothetical protein